MIISRFKQRKHDAMMFVALLQLGALSLTFAAQQRDLPENTQEARGLYATVSSYLSVSENVKVKGERTLKLVVPGFLNPEPVEAVIQDTPAPLVVVLLGISGRTDSDFSRLWPSYFADAGYNVLFFDSTFRPEFVARSGHGASGNIWAECERASAIIATFLQHPDVRGKVPRIGIVGMSYGGSQALILGKTAREGGLPFNIAAIQAYSPPIRMDHTAAILDDWFHNDRWRYTLAEMEWKLTRRHLAPPGAPIPFSSSLMRGAMAASFHDELPGVVLANVNAYAPHLLPQDNDVFNGEFRRREFAEAWPFRKYVYDLALPYWQARLGDETLNLLLNKTSLCELLASQPQYSETILAEDDPFDLPEDMAMLRACAASARVTLLPTGGHLGYMTEPHIRAKLMTLFGPTDNRRDITPTEAPAAEAAVLVRQNRAMELLSGQRQSCP